MTQIMAHTLTADDTWTCTHPYIHAHEREDIQQQTITYINTFKHTDTHTHTHTHKEWSGRRQLDGSSLKRMLKREVTNGANLTWPPSLYTVCLS